MKTIAFSIAALFMVSSAHASNSANACEIVTMKLNLSNAAQEDARIVQFHDAEQFVESVYDDKDGFVREIEGNAILAVMCTRDSLIPTLRDLPLIKTGLPLSLSQNFDSPESGLLTLYDDGAAYKADYSGPDSLAPNAAELNNVMEIFNFQRLTK